MTKSAIYYQFLERASRALLPAMAEINHVDATTITNIDWIGRRYRRILQACATEMEIIYPGPGPIHANSTFDEAADYLAGLAENQAAAAVEAIVPVIPSAKEAKQAWRSIENLIKQKLSERCGQRVVDLSLTTTLGPWAGAVDEAVGKVLRIEFLRGFTPNTSIAIAVEMTLKQRTQLGAIITPSPNQPTTDWGPYLEAQRFRDRVLGPRN